MLQRSNGRIENNLSDLVCNTYFNTRIGVEVLAGEGWHRIKRCGTATG
jgi:hypothetical protein